MQLTSLMMGLMGAILRKCTKFWKKRSHKVQYGRRNHYDKMVVYPLAGRAFTEYLSKFERLGAKVDYSQNVKFMQVPVVGSG